MDCCCLQNHLLKYMLTKHALCDLVPPVFSHTGIFAAIRFLRRRFLVWHHATKRLVPDVNTQCKDYYDDKYKVQQEVMNFIFKNILELKKKYTIVEYSNVNEEETLINREKKNIHFYEDIS